MGVFHWSRLVSNYVFFEGREGRLYFPGLATVDQQISICLIFRRPSTTLYPDCGSAHLETILSWISTAFWLHLPSCPGEVPGLHLQTGRQHKLTILKSKQACHKHN